MGDLQSQHQLCQAGHGRRVGEDYEPGDLAQSQYYRGGILHDR